MRWLRNIGLLGGLAGLLSAGLAHGLASAEVTPIQGKPPVLAPSPAPGGKFAPAPIPVPAPAAPQVDKFAAPPAAPPAMPPVAGDKFGAPPALPPAAAAPVPANPPATPAPAVPVPAAPVPADEPPALGQLRALLGADVSLTYASAVITDPATGALRLTDVLLRQTDSKIAAAELLLDRPRPDGIAGLVAQGVTLTAEDGTVTLIAKVELRDLTVARPAPGQTLRPDQMTLGFLRLDALAVQGARPVAITEVVVQDYRLGRAGRVSLAGVDALIPEAGVLDRVKIGRVALEGIDLPGVLTALAAGEAPARPPSDYSIAVEGVTLTQGDALVGSLGALRLAGAQGQALGQGGPDTGRMTLEGLRVEPFPMIEEWLRKLGYTALTGDLSAETRFDAAAGRLEMVGMLLGIRDAAAMGLSFTLEGVTAETASKMDFQNARLAAFGIRYLDQSLLRRLAMAEAGGTRRTEKQIRDGWANQAAGVMAGGGAVTTVLTAVQRLLRGQATEVTITAAPPKPIPFSELPPLALGGPPAMQRMLGITATSR